MYIEVEGKTYEEAVRKACEELKVDEKDLEIEIKEVDTRGILGILGSKKVLIRARIKEKPEEFGKKMLKEIGRLLGIPFYVKVQRSEDRINFLINCEDGELLIGKEGERLLALQYLLDLAISKRFKERMKIFLDINGFREKRRKFLVRTAKRLADVAKNTGKAQKVGPLNSYERRIIHTTLKNVQGVETKSEGEGPMKVVIILPKEKPNV